MHTNSTYRDSWCWNFSIKELTENIQRTINFYNTQCEAVKAGKDLDLNPKMFSWIRATRKKAEKNTKFKYDSKVIRVGEYSPFTENYLYLQ